jgi:curved DNA-binding protein CbpA
MTVAASEAGLTALTDERTITEVPLPASVYLQSATGEPVGPMPTQWLEFLYHAGIIDTGTPISLNGRRWRSMGDWTEMVSRLHEVDRELRAGQNPWPLVIPRDAGSAPSGTGSIGTGDLPPRAPSAPGTPDIPPAATTGTGTLDIPGSGLQRAFEGPPLAAWLRWAADRASGEVTVERPEGAIVLALRGGKVARVETRDGSLTLANQLVAKQVASPESIQAAAGQVASFGGDLGAALVGTGTIAPDRFFAAFVECALEVLAALATAPSQTLELAAVDVPNPPVPLGLDRLGAVMQAVRLVPKSVLAPRFQPERGRPLIQSTVEGVSVEDLQLRPRELRTLNFCSGARTVGKVLDELGTDEERMRSVLQVLFFVTQTGLAMLGEDPLLKQEMAEAAEIQKELERIDGWSHFDVLSVPKTTTDDTVRTRYTELAKKYHPDGLRAEAAPALREVRQRMFGLVSDAFAALETESRRKRYLEELERDEPNEDLVKAQNALLAETCFKKAEVLMRVRKYDEALAQIDQALELNPDEPEFRVFHIYLGYLLRSRGDPSHEVIEETIEAVKDASRSHDNMLSAHLFTAQLYKALGNAKLMVRSYRRVLEIDANHAEAQQELRLEQMRREKEKSKKKGWFKG